MGGGESNKKIAWVEWKKVCNSKEQGELGVKELTLFNKALLGKWMWQFLIKRGSLWVRVLESKYGEFRGRGRIVSLWVG